MINLTAKNMCRPSRQVLEAQIRKSLFFKLMDIYFTYHFNITFTVDRTSGLMFGVYKSRGRRFDRIVEILIHISMCSNLRVYQSGLLVLISYFLYKFMERSRVDISSSPLHPLNRQASKLFSRQGCVRTSFLRGGGK